MFDQCAKCDFIVRRGRNNRLLVRTIHQKVFNDALWWGHEQDIFSKGSSDVYND